MSKSWLEMLKLSSNKKKTIANDQEQDSTARKIRRPRASRENAGEGSESEEVAVAFLIGILSMLPFMVIAFLLPDEMEHERFLVAHVIVVTFVIVWVLKHAKK